MIFYERLLKQFLTSNVITKNKFCLPRRDLDGFCLSKIWPVALKNEPCSWKLNWARHTRCNTWTYISKALKIRKKKQWNKKSPPIFPWRVTLHANFSSNLLVTNVRNKRGYPMRKSKTRKIQNSRSNVIYALVTPKTIYWKQALYNIILFFSAHLS